MQVERDIAFETYILHRIEEEEFSVREGVHCTDLLYCLNKQACRKFYPAPNTQQETLLFSLGWSTQRWLTRADKDAPEIIRDGITVTPDSYFESCPWELKTTFQSSEKPVEDNGAWVRQVMSQCYVSSSLVGRISRLELAGNWKSIFGKKEEKSKTENQKPTLHAYKLTFTQEELDRHWEWMKVRRDLYLKVLETKALLPKVLALASGMSWECDFCKPNIKMECEK